jgi:lipopolysaccharide/colanic/teichoic acid biosynthesis glycosyltransferase
MDSLWAVIIGVLGSLVAAEVYLWLPSLANRLLRYNAAKLPSEISPRLLEEWQAVLTDIPGNLSKFFFALDLFRGRPRMIHEFYFPEVPFHLSRLFTRLLDISMSATQLLLCAPLMLMVAALIKLDSPGPIFFRQERVGLYKRRFHLIKFRTMVDGADQFQQSLGHVNEAAGPVFKFKDDPRITRVGKILRRFSIDELPQLMNVLKGEMSLVGPRPLPVWDAERINATMYKRRFAVKPGITCLWQVSDWRHYVSFIDWMRMDLEFIDKYSTKLYVQILLKTIPAVLRSDRRSSQ